MVQALYKVRLYKGNKTSPCASRTYGTSIQKQQNSVITKISEMKNCRTYLSYQIDLSECFIYPIPPKNYMQKARSKTHASSTSLTFCSFFQLRGMGYYGLVKPPVLPFVQAFQFLQM